MYTRRRIPFAFGLYLLLLLSLGMALVSCGQSPPPPNPSVSVPTWIRQHALPLSTTEPGGSDKDLQPLKPLIGTATIVGLGQATHGAHEFFTLNQRLLEFLVKQMGFTTVAFQDGNWDPIRPLDSYVLTGKGDAKQLRL